MTGLRMAMRFLRGQYGRRVLTVLALALGVALVFALDVVTASMRRAFDEVIDTMAGRAALEVRAASEGGLVPEELVASIARVAGVELAVPVVGATAFLADGSGESVAVHGVDLLNEAQLRVYRADGDDGRPIDDPVRFLADPRAVVLTRSFAARHGLQVGDAIDLATPHGKRTLSILAVLEPHGVARVYGGNLVVMDIAAAQELFAEPGLVTRIDVVVDRAARVDEVRRAVAEVLPAGLTVTTPAQRKLDLQRVMGSFQLLLRGIGGVGIVLAYLIAFNGLSWEFERRAWQLGILSALGVRDRVIWRTQMQEAFLLGLVGLVLGAALGMALARALLPVMSTATALNFNVIAPEATLRPGGASMAVALVLGIGVALLAAGWPAARAVRIGSAATIRGRAVEPAAEPVSARTRLWGVLTLASLTLLAAVVQQHLGLVAGGLVATALLIVTLALAATPLVRAATATLLPLLTAVAGATGRLAAVALRDRPRRVGMSVAVIAVGGATLVWLAVLARSFEGSVVEALGRAIRADVVVTSANLGGGFLEAPMGEEVLDEVRHVGGLAAVAGWRAVEWPYDDGPVGISAYDGAYFLDPRFGEWTLQEGMPSAWQQVARGEAVVVSSSFVSTTGRTVGDRVVLLSPSGPVELPIVGVTVDFVSPRGTIEMSRALFAERWRDHDVTRIFAVKERAASAAEIRQRIAAELGERFQLRVLSAAELLEYFARQVRRAFAVVPILAALVLAVILVGLGQALAASVLDRRRELATAHAIGMRATRIRRSVTLEAALVGGIGLVLAGSGGAVLSWLWVRGTFQLLLGWALEVHVPALELLAIAALTVAVAVLSSWLPARAAERLSVSEVLRSE